MGTGCIICLCSGYSLISDRKAVNEERQSMGAEITLEQEIQFQQ